MELQDIFGLHIDDYLKKYSPSYDQRKAIRAIMDCRTAALGAHIDVCTDCGALRISYNSCNNRHCNKCQTMNKEKWLAARRDELLDTGYFHSVFTLPSELNPLFYHNKKLLYDLLFKASAETVLELCGAKNHLNGQPGITAVLHTWGQNLDFHPHIHQIIPGGVLTADGKWRKSSDKFLLPIKAVRRKFRGKFLYCLKRAHDRLQFFGDDIYLQDPARFNAFLTPLYNKEWVVYSKAPFKNAGKLLDYLGRYTHRVAISNNRILSCENGTVSFKWRDRRDENREKVMTLSAVEFIRRILMHVLPARFMKIRHYGFLSNARKKEKLRLAQRLTNSRLMPLVREKITVRDIMLRITGRDICFCRHCGGALQTVHSRDAPSPQIFISFVLGSACV
jgi:hypothetical protein